MATLKAFSVLLLVALLHITSGQDASNLPGLGSSSGSSSEGSALGFPFNLFSSFGFPNLFGGSGGGQIPFLPPFLNSLGGSRQKRSAAEPGQPESDRWSIGFHSKQNQAPSQGNDLNQPNSQIEQPPTANDRWGISFHSKQEQANKPNSPSENNHRRPTHTIPSFDREHRGNHTSKQDQAEPSANLNRERRSAEENARPNDRWSIGFHSKQELASPIQEDRISSTLPIFDREGHAAQPNQAGSPDQDRWGISFHSKQEQASPDQDRIQGWPFIPPIFSRENQANQPTQEDSERAFPFFLPFFSRENQAQPGSPEPDRWEIPFSSKEDQAERSNRSQRAAEESENLDDHDRWSIGFHSRQAEAEDDAEQPSAGHDDPQNRFFFSLFTSRLGTCNYTENPGRTCSGCSQTRLCLPSNAAIFRPCFGFFPFCNNGRCSLYQSAACANSTG